MYICYIFMLMLYMSQLKTLWPPRWTYGNSKAPIGNASERMPSWLTFMLGDLTPETVPVETKRKPIGKP